MVDGGMVDGGGAVVVTGVGGGPGLAGAGFPPDVAGGAVEEVVTGGAHPLPLLSVIRTFRSARLTLAAHMQTIDGSAPTPAIVASLPITVIGVVAMGRPVCPTSLPLVATG